MTYSNDPGTTPQSAETQNTVYNAAIQPKSSDQTGVVPQSAELIEAEIAINTADGLMWTKDANGNIVQIGGTGGPVVESINGMTGVVDLGLEDLDDTANLNQATNKQVLGYDSATSRWVPQNQGLGAVTSVNSQTGVVEIGVEQLDDYNGGTPQIGQVLKYNGAGWAPSADTGPVTSVNGESGSVTLGITDLDDFYTSPSTMGDAYTYNSLSEQNTGGAPVSGYYDQPGEAIWYSTGSGYPYSALVLNPEDAGGQAIDIPINFTAASGSNSFGGQLFTYSAQATGQNVWISVDNGATYVPHVADFDDYGNFIFVTAITPAITTSGGNVTGVSQIMLTFVQPEPAVELVDGDILQYVETDNGFHPVAVADVAFSGSFQALTDVRPNVTIKGQAVYDASLSLNNRTNTHDVTLQAPNLDASYTLKLPTTEGTAGYVLTTDGNDPAQLTWSEGGGAVESVNSQTGVVELDAFDLTDVGPAIGKTFVMGPTYAGGDITTRPGSDSNYFFPSYNLIDAEFYTETNLSLGDAFYIAAPAPPAAGPARASRQWETFNQLQIGDEVTFEFSDGTTVTADVAVALTESIQQPADPADPNGPWTNWFIRIQYSGVFPTFASPGSSGSMPQAVTITTPYDAPLDVAEGEALAYNATAGEFQPTKSVQTINGLTNDVNLGIGGLSDVAYDGHTLEITGLDGVHFTSTDNPAGATSSITLSSLGLGTLQHLSTGGSAYFASADAAKGATILTSGNTGQVWIESNPAHPTGTNNTPMIALGSGRQGSDDAAERGYYIGARLPLNLTTSTTYILPSADGAAGEVLTTSGAGVLSWQPGGGSSGGGGGAVDSVNNLTGNVEIGVSNLSDYSGATPATGQTITFDGQQWVPGDLVKSINGQSGDASIGFTDLDDYELGQLGGQDANLYDDVMVVQQLPPDSEGWNAPGKVTLLDFAGGFPDPNNLVATDLFMSIVDADGKENPLTGQPDVGENVPAWVSIDDGATWTSTVAEGTYFYSDFGGAPVVAFANMQPGIVLPVGTNTQGGKPSGVPTVTVSMTDPTATRPLADGNFFQYVASEQAFVPGPIADVAISGDFDDLKGTPELTNTVNGKNGDVRLGVFDLDDVRKTTTSGATIWQYRIVNADMNFVQEYYDAPGELLIRSNYGFVMYPIDSNGNDIGKDVPLDSVQGQTWQTQAARDWYGPNPDEITWPDDCFDGRDAQGNTLTFADNNPDGHWPNPSISRSAVRAQGGNYKGQNVECWVSYDQGGFWYHINANYVWNYDYSYTDGDGNYVENKFMQMDGVWFYDCTSPNVFPMTPEQEAYCMTLPGGGYAVPGAPYSAITEVWFTFEDPTDVTPLAEEQVLAYDEDLASFQPLTLAPVAISGDYSTLNNLPGSWTVTSDPANTEYVFSGPGFDSALGNDTNPTLYMVRGETYSFTKPDAAHPFQLQTSAGIGQPLYTDGVTVQETVTVPGSDVAYYATLTLWDPNSETGEPAPAAGEAMWIPNTEPVTDYALNPTDSNTDDVESMIIAGGGFDDTITIWSKLPGDASYTQHTGKVEQMATGWLFLSELSPGIGGSILYNNSSIEFAFGENAPLLPYDITQPGTQPLAKGTLTIEVQMDAPAQLYYQCTAHAVMQGTIEILEPGQGGSGGGAVSSVNNMIGAVEIGVTDLDDYGLRQVPVGHEEYTYNIVNENGHGGDEYPFFPDTSAGDCGLEWNCLYYGNGDDPPSYCDEYFFNDPTTPSVEASGQNLFYYEGSGGVADFMAEFSVGDEILFEAFDGSGNNTGTFTYTVTSNPGPTTSGMSQYSSETNAIGVDRTWDEDLRVSFSIKIYSPVAPLLPPGERVDQPGEIDLISDFNAGASISIYEYNTTFVDPTTPGQAVAYVRRPDTAEGGTYGAINLSYADTTNTDLSALFDDAVHLIWISWDSGVTWYDYQCELTDNSTYGILRNWQVPGTTSAANVPLYVPTPDPTTLRWSLSDPTANSGFQCNYDAQSGQNLQTAGILTGTPATPIWVTFDQASTWTAYTCTPTDDSSNADGARAKFERFSPPLTWSEPATVGFSMTDPAITQDVPLGDGDVIRYNAADNEFQNIPLAPVAYSGAYEDMAGSVPLEQSSVYDLGDVIDDPGAMTMRFHYNQVTSYYPDDQYGGQIQDDSWDSAGKAGVSNVDGYYNQDRIIELNEFDARGNQIGPHVPDYGFDEGPVWISWDATGEYDADATWIKYPECDFWDSSVRLQIQNRDLQVGPDGNPVPIPEWPLGESDLWVSFVEPETRAPGVKDGDFLKYHESSQKWQAGPLAASVFELDDVSNNATVDHATWTNVWYAGQDEDVQPMPDPTYDSSPGGGTVFLTQYAAVMLNQITSDGVDMRTVLNPFGSPFDYTDFWFSFDDGETWVKTKGYYDFYEIDPANVVPDSGATHYLYMYSFEPPVTSDPNLPLEAYVAPLKLAFRDPTSNPLYMGDILIYDEEKNTNPDGLNSFITKNIVDAVPVAAINGIARDQLGGASDGDLSIGIPQLADCAPVAAQAGQFLQYDGAIEKWTPVDGGAVTSVNSQSGDVTIGVTDLTDFATVNGAVVFTFATVNYWEPYPDPYFPKSMLDQNGECVVFGWDQTQPIPTNVSMSLLMNANDTFGTNLAQYAVLQNDNNNPAPIWISFDDGPMIAFTYTDMSLLAAGTYPMANGETNDVDVYALGGVEPEATWQQELQINPGVQKIQLSFTDPQAGAIEIVDGDLLRYNGIDEKFEPWQQPAAQGVTFKGRPLMQSPDGTWYQLQVADGGALTTRVHDPLLHLKDGTF